MSEHVDDGTTDTLPDWSPRQGPEQTLKSLAKHLAQSATAGIDDRHVRARVRISCYNQTLSLLRQVDGRWSENHRRLRRLLTIAIAIAAGAVAALVIAIIV